MKGNITLFFLQEILFFMLDFFAEKAYNIIKRIYPAGSRNPGKKDYERRFVNAI